MPFCIAALAVIGCGTQQMPSPIGGGAAASWMAAEAKDRDLVYLSDARTNEVDIYSYPDARLVGKLKSFGRPRGECADAQGNVWIADLDADQVVEFAHGGTEPISALSTPGEPGGCSVDPHTGNLAVTSGSLVSVYHQSVRGIWRDPHQYRSRSMRAAAFCGYDGAGNLFLDGVRKSGSFELAELPRGKRAFIEIALHRNIAAPGQVQWDGANVAVGDTGAKPSAIYQFSVDGRKATEVGSTTLDGTKSVRQFWIEGNTVVAPDFERDVGFWRYPQGGKPTDTISAVSGYGAAVSVASPAPSHPL